MKLSVAEIAGRLGGTLEGPGAAVVTGVASLRDLQRLVRPVELVGEADARHVEALAVVLRKVTQRAVEAARPQQKSGVQYAAAVEAAREAVSGDLGARFHRIQTGLEPRAIRRQQYAPSREACAWQEQPGALQPIEIRGVQPLDASAREGDKQLNVDALSDHAVVEQAL